jgi:hypothetical protein
MSSRICRSSLPLVANWSRTWMKNSLRVVIILGKKCGDLSVFRAHLILYSLFANGECYATSSSKLFRYSSS